MKFNDKIIRDVQQRKLCRYCYRVDWLGGTVARALPRELARFQCIANVGEHLNSQSYLIQISSQIVNSKSLIRKDKPNVQS